MQRQYLTCHNLAKLTFVHIFQKLSWWDFIKGKATLSIFIDMKLIE